jgi:hypothetical protein
MSITVRIYFTADLSHVVITDVSSGEETVLEKVSSGDHYKLEPDDYLGEATVDISAKVSKSEQVQERNKVRNGAVFDFPPKPSSALDEIRQFGSLSDLVNNIKELVK